MTRFVSLLGAGALVSMAVVMSGCNSDWNTQENLSKAEEQQGLVFTMAEEQFGDDVEVRALAKPDVVDTVDVADGVEAEVAIERDVAEERALTRALKTDNHYTIVAFETGTGKEKGRIKGRFNLATGAFVADVGTPQYIVLSPGEHCDFVCYSDQYISREGNTLTISLPNAHRALAGKATNVEILPQRKQSVTFRLQRFGARVRTKLVAPLPLPSNIGAKIVSANNAVPRAVTLNMVSWSTANLNNGTLTAAEQNFAGAPVYNEGGYSFNTMLSTGYAYVLSGTRSEQLSLSFTRGALYNQALASKPSVRFNSGKTFVAGGSYVIRMKLLPKYKYLFNDGRVGYLKTPGRAGFVPIALVVGNGLAIALWDVESGGQLAWHTFYGFVNQCNPRAIVERGVSSDEDYRVAINDPETGINWTWVAHRYSGATYAQVKANEKGFFPAFYHCAHFDTELVQKYCKGKGLASNVSGYRRWFLASVNPWVLVYTAISLQPRTSFSHWGYWNKFLLHKAFRDAGGTPLKTNDGYWTSAESATKAYDLNNVVSRHTMWPHDGWLSVGASGSSGDAANFRFYVRPFVSYLN